MSTESTTKPVAPLWCRACGDQDGPFAVDGHCEDCAPAAALRSALADGGHLDDNALRLMRDYAASVLRDTAGTLRTSPDCETAAQLVDKIAQGWGK